MKTPYTLVKDFHRAMGHPVNSIDLTQTGPEIDAFIELRKTLIQEEAKELCDALTSRDLAQILKEESDLTYVSRGLLVGLKNIDDPDTSGAFSEVHNSNMSKLGRDGKPVYREDGKVMKGPDYFPPDMSRFVKSSNMSTFLANVFIPDGLLPQEFFEFIAELQLAYPLSKHYTEQHYSNEWVFVLDIHDDTMLEHEVATLIEGQFDCKCSYTDVIKMHPGWRPVVENTMYYSR